jgi:hypothetical protein
MNQIPARGWSLAFTVAIVALTLATAYIHFTLGGLLFLLNAAGYVTLAVLLVVPIAFIQRLRPLVLLALMAYAATTILGWAINGPYYSTAYIAKAIEVALIALIAIELYRKRSEIVPAFNYLRQLAVGTARRVLGRAAPDSAEA